MIIWDVVNIWLSTSILIAIFLVLWNRNDVTDTKIAFIAFASACWPIILFLLCLVELCILSGYLDSNFNSTSIPPKDKDEKDKEE